jgi:hypothetical protein
MKNRAFLLPLTFGAALVLSACGGGGGGAGNSTSVSDTGPTTTLTAISFNNAGKAASNAFVANGSISNSSATATDSLTGVSLAGLNTSVVAPTLDLIKLSYNRVAPELLTGVERSDPCPGGGKVTINFNRQNPDVISNGDTIALTLDNCVENGVAFNGGFNVKLSGISGNPASDVAFNATFDVLFNAFRASAGSEAVSVNGDMKIELKQASPTSESILITGNTLETSETQGGVLVASRVMSGYSVTATTQGATFSSKGDFNLSGNTTGLGPFKYSVKNIQPFISTGNAAPTSGSLIVNGASSSVTMTVIDTASNVRLDHSAKGDGVITGTSTVSWPTFISSK